MQARPAHACIHATPQASLRRLLAARRLVVVLDLDHTLLNSIKLGEVTPEVDYKLEQLAAEQARACCVCVCVSSGRWERGVRGWFGLAQATHTHG
jgi:predicted HAD superfamily phosphohydrolase YqeG